MGIVVLILTLWRLSVRAAHPAPALPATLRPWEIAVVGLVHGLLYVLLILQPLSGWMVYTLSTHKSLFFGLFRIPDLPFAADLGITAGQLPFLEELHGTLAGILAVTVLLHIGAAFKHHFVVRDDVLLRMSPARLVPFLQALRAKR
ncbi:Cytochrome b561 [Desulfovibrio sp. TomC]|nr:Cytochrome b561 [Desulfovibrio sp. TomC]